MSQPSTYPAHVFTSLKELMGMERFGQLFGLLSRKQKVKTLLGGKHASKMRGRGLDFEEVRHYVKGDDIRNIDWKVTARTKETHSRVYSEEKEKPALILVDQSQSMFFGSQKRMKSVAAAEIAALAAFRVLKEGDRVGGIVFSDQSTDILYPKRDRKNILRFLEKIVAKNHQLKDFQPGKFEDTLQEVTRQTRNIVTHDFTIIIISDFHRYSPEVLRSMHLLSQHNDLIVVKIYDPLERDIPTENFVVGDNKTQVTIKGKQNNIRSKFSSGFDQKFTDFQVQLKKRGIPLFLIDTVRSIDEQLKEIFKSNRK
jgi:uncharacterized protein (DUF58 family)